VTLNRKTRRRWFGAVCLLVAIAMLVAEGTLLKDRLGDVASLAYWLVCFICTLLAIGAAFQDLRELRRETREEQRALLEQTVEQIRKEKAVRNADSPDRDKAEL